MIDAVVVVAAAAVVAVLVDVTVLDVLAAFLFHRAGLSVV